jgi:hypothetical protein
MFYFPTSKIFISFSIEGDVLVMTAYDPIFLILGAKKNGFSESPLVGKVATLTTAHFVLGANLLFQALESLDHF